MRTIRSATPATGCGTTDKTTKACELDIFRRCAVTVVQFRIIAPRVETSTGPVVRIYGSSRGRSDGAQIVRGGLTRPSISNNVERDLLSLVEVMDPSAFDRADVDEDILAAIIRLRGWRLHSNESRHRSVVRSSAPSLRWRRSRAE
jgi:hypothetical protein